MNTDNVLYELGVDLDNNLTFKDGDICLIKYDENLVQAVVNRLNTGLNELYLFYNEYGSVFKSFFGWRGTDETLGFVRAELETVLKSENRLYGWSIDLEYSGDGVLKVDLVLNPNPFYSVDVSLRLTDNGVEVI